MNNKFIRSFFIASTLGLSAVFTCTNANAQEYTSQQLFQKVQQANCRLHNSASIFTMNKGNYRSMIKCHGTWQNDPNFRKEINPDLVKLAISVAGPQDVATALRNIGVLQ